MSDQQVNSRGTAFSFVVTYGLSFLLLWFSVNGSPSFDYRATKKNPTSMTTITENDTSERNVQNLVVMLCIVGFTATRAVSMLRTGLNNLLVFVAPSVALLSAAWSQDPSASLAGGLRLLMSTAFAIYLAVRFKPRDQMRLLIVTGAMFCVLNVLTATMLPQYGIEPKYVTYAWRGIASYKNVCAYSTALLMAPAWFLGPRSSLGKLGVAAYLVAQGTVVMMTASVTGMVMVASLAILCLVFSLSNRMAWKQYVVFAGVLATALAAAFLMSWGLIVSVLTEMGKGSTLNGRTTIWIYVFQSVIKHPINGYGYHAFWRGLQGESGTLMTSGRWYPSFAHNGYLEVWLEVGLAGLIPLLLMFYRSISNGVTCLRLRSGDGAAWYMATMVLLAICNVSEGTLLVGSSLGWIVFVLCYIGSVERKNQALTEAARCVESAGVAP